MKHKQKKLQKKEEKNRQRRLRLRKQSVKKTAPMKIPKREKKAPMKKLVVKVKAKRREEAKSIKKFKNTKFLLDTNTIFDRKTYKDNILQLMKGSGNKILLSTLVMEETRKHEKTQTQKSIIDELGDLFGDRVEHTVITNEMKKKGKELEKKHESLGLHYPDSHILAQAIMIKGVIITADKFLIDSCNAEDVDVYDQREYIQKKPKMKKKKAIKPQKKYDIFEVLGSDDHQP